MTRNAAFWRNAIVIAVVHLVVLAGLARWSGNAKTPPPLSNIVWVEAPVPPAPEASLVEEAAEVPAEQPTPPPMEDPLTMRTPPPSDIDDATPTPQPTSTPHATAKPTPKPTPNKKLIPKASKSASKRERAQHTEKTSVRSREKSNESAAPSGNAGRRAVVNEKLVSYAKMLHDRFDREWVQPTGLPPGAHYSLSVHLRIERDGRIAEFKLARSSGNVVVDESVEAAGRRVTQVEPLPAELATSNAYALNVNFELDAK